MRRMFDWLAGISSVYFLVRGLDMLMKVTTKNRLLEVTDDEKHRLRALGRAFGIASAYITNLESKYIEMSRPRWHFYADLKDRGGGSLNRSLLRNITARLQGTSQYHFFDL